MRKKRIPDVLLRPVMSLCERVKIRVRVDCKLSKKCQVKIWMHQGNVLSMEWGEMLCDELRTVKEFTYRVTECAQVDDVIARTRYWLVMFSQLFCVAI